MFGYAVLIVTMVVMKLAPRSSLGRWLNLHLVELPLRSFDYRRVIWLALFLVLAFGMSDLLPLLGGTDFLAVYAWDMTVYFDATLIAYALVGVARSRSALRWVALRARPLVRRAAGRARRTRTVSVEPGSGANDDEPGPDWSVAA